MGLEVIIGSDVDCRNDEVSLLSKNVCIASPDQIYLLFAANQAHFDLKFLGRGGILLRAQGSKLACALSSRKQIRLVANFLDS